MIKANELRIGNKLLFVVEHRRNPINRVVDVCSLNKNKIVVKDMGFDVAFEAGDNSLQATPLTSEILRKSGFQRESELSVKHKDHSAIRIVESRELLMVYKGSAGAITEVKHLHQLQNLYFALTGTELEINL